MSEFWQRVLFEIEWFILPSVLEERKDGSLKVSKIIDGHYYYKIYR
jgi:hypothetical protein